uniref:Putative secreted protein n=1 Tax=Anopheles darlingi TaxID=43151 RepID=A0A2M4DE68_ANODA
MTLRAVPSLVCGVLGLASVDLSRPDKCKALLAYLLGFQSNEHTTTTTTHDTASDRCKATPQELSLPITFLTNLAWFTCLKAIPFDFVPSTIAFARFGRSIVQIYAAFVAAIYATDRCWDQRVPCRGFNAIEWRILISH